MPGLARTGNTPEHVDRTRGAGAGSRQCGASIRSAKKSNDFVGNQADNIELFPDIRMKKAFVIGKHIPGK